MYKAIKISLLVLLVVAMCTYSTYSVEPEAVPAQESIPASEVPSELDDATEQPIADEEDKARKDAADAFRKDVEAIVIKHIDSYHQKGGKGTAGVFIKELGTGFEYSYNGEKTNPDAPAEGYFNTASTCKLLSAAVMYYLNECGELELDTDYCDLITGRHYILEKLLPKMISHSVNDYFNITLRHLGSARINQLLLKLGTRHSVVYSEIMPAEATSIKSNIKRYGISKSPRTTPRDLGHILQLLYEGKVLGEENSKRLTRALLDNIYCNRLPAGVAYRSPVAHKTGTSSGEGVYNDAGIIFLEGNPYIMVIMSKGSGSNIQSLFRSMAGDVYEYMKKRTENQSPVS